MKVVPEVGLERIPRLHGIRAHALYH